MPAVSKPPPLPIEDSANVLGATIPPSSSLLAERILSNTSIWAIRESVYDNIRERGERVTEVSSKELLQKLDRATEIALAVWEDESSNLSTHEQGELATKILRRFLDDPKQTLKNLDISEQRSLQKIEIRMAGAILQRFTSQLDLTEPALQTLAQSRFLRELRDGNFDQLEHLAPLLNSQFLKGSECIKQLSQSFIISLSHHGAEKTFPLLEQFPFNKTLDHLIQDPTFRNICVTEVHRSIVTPEEPLIRERGIAKPWLKTVISLLPESADSIGVAIVDATQSFDLRAVKQLMTAISLHPDSSHVLATVASQVKGFILSRIGAGCLEEDILRSGELRVLAATHYGHRVVIDPDYIEATQKGLHKLIGADVPLPVLLEQLCMVPPRYRPGLLEYSDTRQKLLEIVVQWNAQFDEWYTSTFHRSTLGVCRNEIDRAEACLGWAVEELSLSPRVLQPFRDDHPISLRELLKPRLPWWDPERRPRLDPYALNVMACQQEKLRITSEIAAACESAYVQGAYVELDGQASNIVKSVSGSEYLPQFHALQGRALLIYAMTAPEERQLQLLKESLNWHLTFLCPDSDQLNDCFRVGSTILKKHWMKNEASLFSELADAVNTANPPADYTLPLSPRRTAALENLADLYGRIATEGALSEVVAPQQLLLSRLWIKTKLNLHRFRPEDH